MSIKEKNTIYYVDSVCSSGKTHSLIKCSIDLIRNTDVVLHGPVRVLIAMKSIQCIEEWYPKAAKSAENIYVHRIHGGLEGVKRGQVKQRLMAYLKSPDPYSEILFVTQQALLDLPYFHKKENWHIIVDEIPAIDSVFSKNLPANHRLLTDYIKIKRPFQKTSIIVPSNLPVLKQYAENKVQDDISEEFRTIAQHILHDHREVYVLNENYQRTIDGDTEGHKYPLYFFSLLQPSVFAGFKSVTIAGACFKDSLLFQLWSRWDVEFKVHEEITKGLRFKTHQNGKRLEVYYLTEQDWSKRFAGKKSADEENFQLALKAVIKIFGDEEFLYLVNKDREEDARRLFEDTKGEPLPYSPHGLNGFDNFNNVVIIASYLYQPFHHRFIETFGLNRDDIRRSINCQIIYQAIMRCSLRNPDSSPTVKVIVPDLHTAEFMEELLPGCGIQKISDSGIEGRKKVGRKRKHLNGAAKTRAHRQRKERLFLENIVENSLSNFRGMYLASLNLNKDSNQESSHQESNNSESLEIQKFAIQSNDDMPLNIDREISDVTVVPAGDFQGSIFSAIRGPNSLEAVTSVFADDSDALVSFLSFLHQKTNDRKGDNFLISPSLFDPNKTTHSGSSRGNDSGPSRGKENVVLARHIWLDVDGGDLSYEEFRKIFPVHQMVIFNTYSSEDKTRFRVFIPTDRYMSAEVYETIAKQLVKVVEDRGYCSKKEKTKGPKKPCHGIDMGKLHAASLFYLPCQPGNGKNAFFEEFDGQPIIVNDWIENNILPIEVVETGVRHHNDNNGNDEKAQKALENGVAKLLSATEGNRNNTLYDVTLLNFKNAYAGRIDELEVENRIRVASQGIGLSTREINATMRSAKLAARSTGKQHLNTSYERRTQCERPGRQKSPGLSEVHQACVLKK